MTAAQPEPAPACPAHDYSPYELKPFGEWTAFYDRLRQASPALAEGFAVSDIETVYDNMVALRTRLQERAALG